MQAPLNGSTTTTNSHSSPSTLRVDIQLSVEDDQLDSNMIWFLLLMVQNSNNHLGCIKTLKIPGNDYQLQLVFSPDFWTINSITLNDFRIFFQCNSSSWWFNFNPFEIYMVVKLGPLKPPTQVMAFFHRATCVFSPAALGCPDGVPLPPPGVPKPGLSWGWLTSADLVIEVHPTWGIIPWLVRDL